MSAEGNETGGPKQAEQAGGRTWKIALVAVVLLAAGAALWLRGLPARMTYPIKEVPTPEYPSMEFGVEQPCARTAAQEVTRYPAFKSAKPLYGRFYVHYAHRKTKPEAGYFLAIDESRGTDSGYDTLYLDANRNLDLTDDKTVKSYPQRTIADRQILFDAVTVPGARDDGGDIVVAPRLRNPVSGELSISFSHGYVRRGSVWLAGKEYETDLVRCNLGEDRYDTDSVMVRLYAPEGGIRLAGERVWIWRQAEEMWGGQSTMFPVKDKWFSLSTTATGDNVSVHPYTGDVGIIRVSYRGTAAGNYIANGTLYCDSGRRVYVPANLPSLPTPPKAELQVPVGNYALEYVSVSLPFYYIAVRRQRPERGRSAYSESDYLLKVSKDAPCVLNIESSAAIAWSGLSEGSAYRPGDVVSARLALETPTLSITWVSQKPTFRSLSATVKVEDSTGKKLAEGRADYVYNWRIPPGFVPRGGRETLRMTATWDTKGLFGVVTGTKDIIIESTGAERGT